MGCHKYPNPFQHLVTYPRWRRHPENGEEYLWASHTRNEEYGQPNTCVHQSPSPLSSLNITILLVLWWFLFPFHRCISYSFYYYYNKSLGERLNDYLSQGHPVSQKVTCCSFHWTNKAGALQGTLIFPAQRILNGTLEPWKIKQGRGERGGLNRINTNWITVHHTWNIYSSENN